MPENHTLSEREKEIAFHLMQGKSNKEIASALEITIRTVEFHLSNVYRKLGVGSRTEAALKLARSHLVESTGKHAPATFRESTVDPLASHSENGEKTISGEKRMRARRIILGVAVGLIVLLVGFGIVTRLMNQTGDYHGDEEIYREAIQSATGIFDRIEMRIVERDPVHVGNVLLNQFLREFRQAETHYGIRLVSYEILEIESVEVANDQLVYSARIQVTPQDGERFKKIMDVAFPYEAHDGEIIVAIQFIVLRNGDEYKLVDIGPE